MKKSLYTLDIDDYAPAIKARTFPLFEQYARKIGATFRVISTRAFPGWPAVYEKLQIFRLSVEHGNDWNVFLDADALIHPDLFDISDHLDPGTIFHYGRDPASVRFQRDEYFRRDGRNIGSCNWFTIGSTICRDLWRPLEDLTLAQATARIFPTVAECSGDEGKPDSVISPEHLIDDYTLSRNIARFGLRVKTAVDVFGELGAKPGYAWHVYNKTNEDKLNGWTDAQGVRQAGMDEVIYDKWRLKQRPALRAVAAG